MDKYFVLIIDIVKSRRLSDEDRFDAQKKIDYAISIVNDVFRKRIVKSLGFSAGDSVQGLFDSISSAYQAYLIVKSAIFPYAIRAGIGCGDLNSLIFKEYHDDDDSNKIDGEAYHLARNAVDFAKKTHGSLIISVEERYDKIINPIIEDEGIIFMTRARKAIFSLINLIDPIIDNRFNLDGEYYKMISPLIHRIANYYRKKSRVNKYRLSFGPTQETVQEELDNNRVNDYLDQYFMDCKNKSEDEPSAISTATRMLLVNLIGSRDQNINQMIRASQMDVLRKRIIAKEKILKYFYEGIEQ